jgi:hypothetical protein
VSLYVRHVKVFHFIGTNSASITLFIVPRSEREDSFYPQTLMEFRHCSYILVTVTVIYLVFKDRASHALACWSSCLLATVTKVGSPDCKRFPPLVTELYVTKQSTYITTK